MKYTVHCPNRDIQGKIKLEGSKSISNRILIIRALCGTSFEIQNLAQAKDTESMMALLDQQSHILDVGPAGTTFRFLTAFLALKGDDHVLTGSSRMKQRPVKPLVDALISLGASIEYIGEEGYSPLRIKGNRNLGLHNNRVQLPADISSQFISALLLIAPYLHNGIELELVGKVASKPYITMTLNLMSQFGIKWMWEDQVISIGNSQYKPRAYFVESDWSAASYFYSIAILSNSCDLTIEGLREKSLQGDAEILKIATQFGVKSTFADQVLHIEKKVNTEIDYPALFEYDFEEVPDLAQTVIVFLAAANIKGLLTGLESLHIKETDRVAALKSELEKAKSYLYQVPSTMVSKSNRIYYILEGDFELENNTHFDTYDDHRMAMCLSPLGLLETVVIDDPMVVVKSFPSFWEKLKSLGFKIKSIE